MLCFVFAALVVALDQFFKHWIVLTLELHEQMDLIPGVIGLTHIQNKGAAFSLLSDQRWLLVGISFIAAVVLVFILLRYTEGFWGTLGLAAVLGGTVGNLLDRVFQGYVVDMFRPLFLDFAIFNIADIFLTLGFATFCIHFIVSSIKSPGREPAAAESVEDVATVEIEDDDPYNIYDIEDRFDIPDYDNLSDTKVVPPRNGGAVYAAQQESYADTQEYYGSAQEPQGDYEPALEQPGYYQPEAAPQEDVSSAIDALAVLGALESELSSIDDYDVDELLREYGFEDDPDDFA